jgi:hypothetical protein
MLWTKVPYLVPYIGTVADFLDLKTHVSSGEADLTVFVLTRNGEIVGKYRGESSFKESFNPTGELAPGARLNQALTEAVHQIQEKILHDVHLRKIAAGKAAAAIVNRERPGGLTGDRFSWF